MSRQAFAILAALVLTACGGSDSPTTGGPVARFNPDNVAPGSNTIAMLHGASAGASVTVRVTVTGVSDFFGAGFRLVYDPDALLFAGWDTSTSFLREGVTAGDVFFSEDHTSVGGQVVVIATRLDPTVVPPVDVGSTSTLATFTFVARKPLAVGAAEGQLEFGDPKQACDGTVVPPGCNTIAVTWWGGGVSAQ